jgi:pimeloyl-ACP methyl ester carboxylesterase|nr:alpha/beta hydrolase [Kofleriaceae bacterium]
MFATASGARAGRAFVFVHGGLANQEASRMYVGGLAPRFRLVTPDLRAHGRSHFGGEVSWDVFADDMAALVTSLGVARVAIGGISFGCGAAVRTALRHPSLVSSVVLLHPPYGGAEHGASDTMKMLMSMMAGFGGRVKTDGLDALLPMFAAAPPGIRERAPEIIKGYDAPSVISATAFMGSLAQPFARNSDLAAVRAPVLVVPGTDAQHPRDVAEVFAAHAPQCTLHDVAVPDFAAAIADFLDAHP